MLDIAWVRYTGATDEQASLAGGRDPREVLEEGETYEVDIIDVHSQHTRVYLVGIEGWFNSVCFEPAPFIIKEGNKYE